MVQIECPECRTLGEVRDALLDRKIRCPECGVVFASDASGDSSVIAGSAAAGSGARGGGARADRSSSGSTATDRRQPFWVGRTFSRSMSIFVRGFVPFTFFALVVHSPLIAFETALALGVLTISESASNTLSMLLTLPFGSILTAVVIHVVFERLRGRVGGISRSLGYGLRRIPGVIGVSILQSLVMIVAVMPGVVMLVVATGGALAMTQGGVTTESINIPLYLGGAIAFLAAMGFVGTGVICATPVVAVERAGVGAAISRSWQLARGNRLRMIGLGIWLSVLFGGVMVLVMVPVVFIPEKFTDVVISVLTTPMQALFSVVLAVLYHDLRVAGEGISSEDLAAVFE